MHFLTSIKPLIEHYGNFGVFLILCFEMIGIPFPAETTLVLAGVGWKQGTFSFLPLFLFGSAGHLLGSTIAYTIGRYLGRPFLLRYQKIFRITDASLNKASERLLKARIPVLIISKFIAGVRIIVPYLAGIERLPFPQFFLWSAVGTILWVLVFILFGQTVAFVIHHTYNLIRDYPLFSVPVIVLIVAIIVSFILYRNKKKAETKAQETLENNSN